MSSGQVAGTALGGILELRQHLQWPADWKHFMNPGPNSNPKVTHDGDILIWLFKERVIPEDRKSLETYKLYIQFLKICLDIHSGKNTLT